MSKYPSIIKAAKEIWYDNGMINQFEPENEKVELLLNWLQTLDSELLSSIEMELSKLSEDELFTACCGEETEQQKLISGPLNELLNQIADEHYEIQPKDMVEIVSYQKTEQLCSRQSQKCIGDLMFVIEVDGQVLRGFDYNFVAKGDVRLVSKGASHE
ncbi:hypothetical protein J542_0554 [Acinetobacter baumannii 299505]|uniref:hypothetical protein n=1 Tax=Acinetobacter baumannii TaxID=470 RepID=UPI00044E4E06|nr:hypothetical protein [Acinetobacter baumannii]EXB85569.1 hypothetical protein J542_0554 [Acinetobacter baumannii 299505]